MEGEPGDLLAFWEALEPASSCMMEEMASFTTCGEEGGPDLKDLKGEGKRTGGVDILPAPERRPTRGEPTGEEVTEEEAE